MQGTSCQNKNFFLINWQYSEISDNFLASYIFWYLIRQEKFPNRSNTQTVQMEGKQQIFWTNILLKSALNFTWNTHLFKRSIAMSQCLKLINDIIVIVNDSSSAGHASKLLIHDLPRCSIARKEEISTIFFSSDKRIKRVKI